jgi:hypothetical protein
MALVLKDRVQETGTANTTISFTLAGAVAGYQSFSVVGDTNTTYYAATDTSGNWEAGLGTYSTTGPTLTRTTILSSSNAGSAVTFSGTVNVFLTYPSSRALYLDGTSANINVSQAAFTANGITYASSTTALATSSALTFNGTNLTTTGTTTAASFIPTGTTVPTYGVFKKAATVLGFSANSSPMLTLSAAGGLGVGTNISVSEALLKIDPTGNPFSLFTPSATNAFGFFNAGGTYVSNNNFVQLNANSLKSSTFKLDANNDETYIVGIGTTLYIEGNPIPYDGFTQITNGYALYVNSGTSYFGSSVTLANGGAFSGTITGTPTFSGAVVLSGTPSISTGAALSGTFTGTPTFSGAIVLSGTPSISNGAALTGTFSGTPTFSGATTQSGGATFSNTTGNKLTVSGAVSRTAWTTTGPAINIAAGTYTSSAGLTGTVAASSFAQPTFAATTAAQTVTNGATLYIAAAPTAGTNVTITNAYSLYINAGAAFFGGATTLNSGGALSGTFTGTPTFSGAVALTGSPTITNLLLAAGTASLAPIDFTAGTLLTTPVEGAMEFDGTAFYTTDDTTDGRGYLASIHYFRLAADVTAFGPAIANFFGATSGMNLDAGVYYEVEAYLYFTKTTAGTATFTMTFSNGPTNNNANYVGTPVGGIATVGSAVTAAIAKSTATAGALPATGSLTNGANHAFTLRSMFQANSTTGGTFNIQITSSGAGTVTPLAGSYYKLTRLPAANTGAFA